MKIAHLADVHLGFRQFHRLTANGINQREVDVAQAFRAAVDGMIEAAPDLVVVAGDLFHSVRPTNTAILDSFNQFSRLRAALPSTPIVVVAGNHDTPRSIETGSILRLFEALGDVHTVSDAPRELTFPALDCVVTCVPHMAWGEAARPTLVPRTDATHRVAVTHGVVRGAFPLPSWAEDYGGPQLEPSDLHADEWSYVALGHYHVAHAVGPNAWYAGALEYTSSNIWGELHDEAREQRPGKGWLLATVDGTSVDVAFQPIPSARRVIDLPPVAGALLSAAELDERIQDAATSIEGGIEGKIIRLVVYDVPRPIARELDHAAIRELKARALHFHLDVRRPETTRPVGVATPGERQTLREIVADFVTRRPLDADVEREALVALAHRYMESVGDEDAA